MNEPNLKLSISPEYNFKRVRNTLECCADYLSDLDLGEAAWLLDDVRDALVRLPDIIAPSPDGRRMAETPKSGSGRKPDQQVPGSNPNHATPNESR
jgi:hypothetical protein